MSGRPPAEADAASDDGSDGPGRGEGSASTAVLPAVLPTVPAAPGPYAERSRRRRFGRRSALLSAVLIVFVGLGAGAGWLLLRDTGLLLLAACGGSSGGILSGGRVDDAEWARTLEVSRPSVGKVHVLTADGSGTGTAFVGADGLFVTNAHVVSGASTIDIELDGGVRGATAAQVREEDDLATVRANGKLPAALPLAAADPVPGDLVRAVGYPLGGDLTATEGRVIEYVDGGPFHVAGCVIRASVDLRPGNSGGPLLDAAGHVAGVVFAVQVHDGIALAVPVSRLAPLLRAAPPRRFGC